MVPARMRRHASAGARLRAANRLDRVLHHHGLDPVAQQLPRLRRQRLIAAHERDGHVQGARERGVERQLADRPAVEPCLVHAARCRCGR